MVLADEHGKIALHLVDVGSGAQHEPPDRGMALAEEEGVLARSTLLQGNVVDEIVAYADERDVDLIVLGSRGHGLLAGALLGSVSQGVVRESKLPVVVVRGLAAAAIPA